MTSTSLNTATMLSELMLRGNLSLPTLAKLLGTSLASVSRWERGDGSPGQSHVERIFDLHRTLVGGELPNYGLNSELFASRGVRSRNSGQGILGEAVPVVTLTEAVSTPIMTRLRIGRVFAPSGEKAICELLDKHSTPAGTSQIAFNAEISAGKNTYTYDAHTYHTKVPPQGICELFQHYLPRGGLVFDPFSGSGMTGVAASVLGHSCLLNELSPAACFIANRFTTSISATEFEAAVDVVLKELSALRERLYTTTCRECGRQTELLYVVWSYKVHCGYCRHEFVLWDSCRSYGRVVRDHKILAEFPCPSCGQNLKKATLRRTTVEPVLVGYKCCGSKQQEATHKPTPEDLRSFRDLESNAPLAEGFFPETKLPDGVNLRQPKKHGLDSVDKLYTRRNLSALSHLWKVIHRVGSVEISGHLAFVFTSLYQRVTRLSEFRFWGGSGNTARFNVPFIFNEANVFKTFERKARTIQDHLETTASSYKGKVVVVNNSATSLDYLPSDSVDLIFTDPPFGANINYSEMNLLWESWLGAFTDSSDEAIVNRVQGKTIANYEELMLRSLQECHRVLRPGHWLLLVFMNSSGAVWNALRNVITSAGFDIKKIQIFDKQHGTFKQFVSENAAGMDLVLHCRKPNGSRPDEQFVAASGLVPDIISFLEARADLLPTTVYLHVKRDQEIDYRTLYSEWVACSFSRGDDLPDFLAFRNVAKAWLEKHGPI